MHSFTVLGMCTFVCNICVAGELELLKNMAQRKEHGREHGDEDKHHSKPAVNVLHSCIMFVLLPISVQQLMFYIVVLYMYCS